MLKLMIVDDEPAELDCLSRMLHWEEYGYELCYTLSNSEKAYEILSSEHIDVLITDISMPSPNGIELAEFLHAEHPEVVVIFVSAYADFEYAQKALACHVFSYITKPFGYEQIVEVLEQVRSEIFSDTDSSDMLSLIAVQQSIVDFFGGKITDIAMQNIYARYFPPIDISAAPVVLLSADISALSSYLQNVWGHDLDRLYACIIRYLNSNMVNFVPLNFLFSKILLIAFPTRANCSCDVLTNACKRAIEEFSSIPAKELRIKLDISILSSHPNLLSSKATLNKINVLPKDEQDAHFDTDNDVIKVALAYIEKHFAEPISIADVSRAAGVSPYHFSRLFKLETNETVANYIISVRLKTAATLLSSTDMNVSDIAKEVGYNSIPHFHKAFKSAYSLTPREYKLQQKQKEDTE